MAQPDPFMGLRDLGKSIRDAFAPARATAPAPVREENKPILSGDAKILHDNVTEALARAHTAAEARAASQPGAPNQFTMTDYFIAAQEMVENGANLTTATMANFAGQTITNAQINKADIEKPPEAIRMAATLRAMQSAATKGRPTKLSDVLKEVQAIKQSGARIDSSPQNLDQMQREMADLANIHGIDDFKHIYDLDGTLSINDFFETIDHHIEFKGTIFSDVTFHPADTLMHNSKNVDGKDSGVALTEGASFNNVVFDGMGADDHLVLKHGTYNEITLKDINRGHVHVTDGTRIDGIDVKGMHAEFSLGKNAFVGGMIVDKETRILTFTMAEGATMAHADLGKAIISPAGVMRNTNWEDIKVGGGLRDVDLSGSSFKSVTFDGTDLKDTNFTGSTLKDVAFKNMTAEQLQALDLSGVKSFDGVTVTINGKDKPINSAKEFELMKLVSASGVSIREHTKEQTASIQTVALTETAIGAPKTIVEPLAERRSTDTPAALIEAKYVKDVIESRSPNNDIAAAFALALGTRIVGGESVSSADIATYNPAANQPRTQPEVTMPITMPGSNKA